MQKWQDANPDNVVFVHCKGGKGRSGSVVSYFLLLVISNVNELMKYRYVRFCYIQEYVPVQMRHLICLDIKELILQNLAEFKVLKLLLKGGMIII